MGISLSFFPFTSIALLKMFTHRGFAIGKHFCYLLRNPLLPLVIVVTSEMNVLKPSPLTIKA
jgi:hypothetical protein